MSGAAALPVLWLLSHWVGGPAWFWSPIWVHHLDHLLGRFITHHQVIGLFLVIFTEELGIPLPAPGDVAIMWGGFMTTRGQIPYPVAYVAVIGGAVLGSLCLFSVSRRFGHPFLVRFGHYIALDQDRLHRAERAFRRWGPWAIIIGRHVPGMRVVLSAFAGAFNVPTRIFVPAVAISAAVWAAIFIEVGRVLGRNSRLLFRILPSHLFPLLVLVVIVLAGLYLAYEHAGRPYLKARREERRRHRQAHSKAALPRQAPGPRRS
jgi:membrane protein DedA with SNARE-associated domain